MARQIKVLRVLGGLDPAFGGPSESAVNQCLAVQAAGAQNTVVYPFHPAISVDNELARRRLDEAGVVTKRFLITRIAGRHSHRWAMSAGASRWMLGTLQNYDVVHVHSAWGVAQLSALSVSRLRSRPCIMSPHESLTDFDIETSTSVPPWAKRTIRRHYMSRVAVIVFSSSAEKRDSMTVRASARAVVIPHPVLGILDRPRAAPRDDGPLVIGFLGRLHPKKNVDLLIRALVGVSGSKLIVAGDGPADQRERLASVADECEVSDRVEWLGFVSGSARDAFLDSVDVLAMPSDYECFGMAAAEAIARGVPTIVSKNCGIAEVVERNQCGLVVEADVESVVAGMTLLENGMRRDRFAKASLRAARDELSVEVFGSVLYREYEALAGARR